MGVGVVVVGLCRTASAGEQTNAQIAQSLFDEGRGLMEQQRYPEACTKFAESQRLDPGGGTLLNLAVCHELEGKTATAWLEFREALSIANRDGRQDRIDLATEHINGLGPKLVRIVVVAPEHLRARNPEVTLDLARLPPAAWGTPVPVDPGEHHLGVLLDGELAWGRGIVTDVPGRTYTIDLSPAAHAERPPKLRSEEHRPTLFYVFLGSAGVLLATSAIAGIAALSADSYVSDNCDSVRNFCRVDDANEAADRARTLAWVSTITMGVGAALGVSAFFLPRTRAAIVPRGDGAYVTLGATF